MPSGDLLFSYVLELGRWRQRSDVHPQPGVQSYAITLGQDTGGILEKHVDVPIVGVTGKYTPGMNVENELFAPIGLKKRTHRNVWKKIVEKRGFIVSGVAAAVPSLACGCPIRGRINCNLGGRISEIRVLFLRGKIC